MKALAVALIALIAPQSSGQTAPGSAITLSIVGGDNLRIRIVPDGTMTLDIDSTDDGSGPGHSKRDLGPASYQRMAALVAPVRRWAGGTVPCERRGTLGPTVIVQWEIDGKQVTVPLACEASPATNDIELVRAAMDHIWRWQRESPPAEAFDGAANAADVAILDNGED